jgi:hypothetical protein
MYYSSAVPVVGQVVAGIYPAWLRAKHKVNWNYLRNPPSRRNFRRRAPELTLATRRVAEKLKASGIALVSFGELVGDPKLYERLVEVADGFRRSGDAIRASLGNPESLSSACPSALKHNLPRVLRYHTDQARGDDYLLKLYPETPLLSLDNPLLQLALKTPVLSVVNSYLDLWGKLRYADYWYTLPPTAKARVGSQYWHRDRDDRQTVKVYLYFTDVGPGEGAMEYIPESRPGGTYQDLWPWRASDPFPYPKEGEVELRVPDKDWVNASGPAGTLVFCDTSGLHRGGPSTTGPRRVATWTFVTPSSLFARRFDLREKVKTYESLPEDARFAIQ